MCATVPLPPLSGQPYALLFHCLCSTSDSVSFVSMLSPVFLLQCLFGSSSRTALSTVDRENFAIKINLRSRPTAKIKHAKNKLCSDTHDQ